MEKTKYDVFDEINELQTNIMIFIDRWVREKKTPVPHKEILNAMKAKGIGEPTTWNSIRTLLIKGYLRRGIVGTGPMNHTCYVLLRTVRASNVCYA